MTRPVSWKIHNDIKLTKEFIDLLRFRYNIKEFFVAMHPKEVTPEIKSFIAKDETLFLKECPECEKSTFYVIDKKAWDNRNKGAAM